MRSTGQRHTARSWIERDVAANGSDPTGADGLSLPFAESEVRRHPIATAMSWLMTCIIEGFAGAAVAQHPYFTDRADWVDSGNREQKAHTIQERALAVRDNPWAQEASEGSTARQNCASFLRSPGSCRRDAAGEQPSGQLRSLERSSIDHQKPLTW
jgi:hypothetical protein